MRRIKQISIKNLFGIFNHDITLNLDERVTIIHSPNGFGKTAILNLLNELFTRGTTVLRTTPFDEFHVYFEDQGHLWIEKKEADTETFAFSVSALGKRPFRQISIFYADSGNQPASSSLLMNSESSVDRLYRLYSILKAQLKTSEDSRMIVDRHVIEAIEEKIGNTRQQLSINELFKEYETSMRTHEQTAKNVREEEQKWFEEIRTSVPTRFIETQRLLNSAKITEGQGTEKYPAMLPAVTLYSEELSETLNARLADSTTLTQELDRTFPSRLMDLAAQQSDISESEVRAKLDELEAKRKSLMAVGLVDQNPNDAVLASNKIDESTKTVLSLYIEDSQKKLAVFDDIAPKIELLTRIINKRFLYKEMSISRKDGFVFTTPRGTRLPLEKLSSGEQHELILFYELLFKTSPGSLIMIDEPEISLHVVWQEQFLQDVQDITRLTDVDVLIATHSPDIIDGHRDLVVELEGPEDGGL